MVITSDKLLPNEQMRNLIAKRLQNIHSTQENLVYNMQVKTIFGQQQVLQSRDSSIDLNYHGKQGKQEYKQASKGIVRNWDEKNVFIF